MKSRSGILFFARTPEAEASAKGWTASARANELLAEKLYRKTYSALKKSNLPIFIVNNHKQEGENFSERITNALSSFFSHGFENALVVGSDCPDLEVSDIHQAAKNIGHGLNTIGATEDGGVYLFSVSKNQFCTARWLELSWCSDSLFHSLSTELTRNNNNNKIQRLKKKIDIDGDLSRLLPVLKAIKSKIKNLIVSILNFTFVLSFCSTQFVFLAKSKTVLRGPPVSPHS